MNILLHSGGRWDCDSVSGSEISQRARFSIRLCVDVRESYALLGRSTQASLQKCKASCVQAVCISNSKNAAATLGVDSPRSKSSGGCEIFEEDRRRRLERGIPPSPRADCRHFAALVDGPSCDMRGALPAYESYDLRNKSLPLRDMAAYSGKYGQNESTHLRRLHGVAYPAPL